MKNTIEVSIGVKDDVVKDELVAQLSNIGFDAFEEKDEELIAFISEEMFAEDELKNLLQAYNLTHTTTTIEDRNWNALWESNFQPVIVDDFCAIRADFHPHFPAVKHEINITPKMSFGTGHHATTFMMMREMSKLDFKDKEVADFGTGTGVLAILAEKLGGKFVLAIDNDEWSIKNSQENVARNNCRHIRIEKADGFSTRAAQFDIILANINKSIILANVNGLLFGLKKKGELLLSGLLKEDEIDIKNAFEQNGLTHVSTVEKNNWICMLFR